MARFVQVFKTAAGRRGGAQGEVFLGMGEVFLGMIDVVVDGVSAPFTITGLAGIGTDDSMTATATRLDGGVAKATSVFSKPAVRR